MPGLRDSYSTTKVLVALTPTVVDTDGNTDGAIIDTRDCDSHLFTAIADTIEADDTITLSILESDDSGMSGATAAGGEDVLVDQNTNEDGGPSTVVMTAGSAVVGKIGYVGNKRYIRLRAAVAGLGVEVEVTVAATYAGRHLHEVPVRPLA